MSIISLIKRAPKRTSAVIAMIAAAIIIPATLLAWGPNRPTYTLANPANHITFNSITDNPNVGDERNFVGIREAGTNGTWLDNVTPVAGKQYTVRMYVHNNAATSLNLTAENVTATVNLPTNTAKSIDIAGFIDSSNASPTEVYDDAKFTSTSDFNLAYQAGSARYYNNAFGPAGIALPNSLFSNTGTPLGYDQLNGRIPGCFQYAGYITFTVTPKFSSYTTKKEVRKLGDTTWASSVNVNPGDTVQYQISYKNTGDTTQDNVTIKDTLPAGVSYIPGTTLLKNGLYPNAKSVDDSLFTANGLNIGSYAPGAAGYLLFNAKIASNDNLPTCGPNTLINKERTTINGGYMDGTANVVVNKTCDNKITVCELATKKIVMIKESQFDASKYSKNLKDCETPGKLVVCELATKKIVTIYEKDFDTKKYSKNLDDCKVPVKITVCEIATKQIVTIDESQFNTSKYTKDMSVCAAPELPHTGPTENIVAFLGLGSIVASVIYYVRSRRFQA